jgi:acyl-CoA synthetase (AMP-forming)/AMP-acid ligase II
MEHVVVSNLLHEPIDRVAAADPQRPALYFRNRAMTFGELSARTRKVAAALERCTAPRDRVAIVGGNHPSWVEAYYGVPRAGRILVLLNYRLAAAELAAIVERSGATIVIGPDIELERVRSLVAVHPHVPTLIDLNDWERMAGETPDPQQQTTKPEPTIVGGAAVADSDAPIWLIYTSGTTGSPKGATLTHRNFAASLLASASGRPIGPDDVFLQPFPLCHVAGYNVLRNLASGRPVVLMDRFAPQEFIALTHRHQVTNTTMAATMLSSLVDYLDENPDARSELSSLNVISYGAAPMPPSLLRRASEKLAVDFSQGYGMTELAGNAVFLGIDDHRRALAGADHLLTAAGLPAPNVEVRVLDDEGLDAAIGTPGEIVVHGDQVMAGYWGDEAATAAAMTDGWFHTGDVGIFDADGVLSVVDRKKDVIVTGAENVSSREVEEAILSSCPEVLEVAVVAVSDPHWGENVCAVIVLRDGATLPAEILIGRVRGRLAGFKAPRHVVEVAQLPRNTLGKLLKQDLRRWLADQSALVGPRF